MDERDHIGVRLTDKQLADLRRCLADPTPKFLTLEEVRERFARKCAGSS
jgi:hypothetical protein